MTMQNTTTIENTTATVKSSFILNAIRATLSDSKRRTGLKKEDLKHQLGDITASKLAVEFKAWQSALEELWVAASDYAVALYGDDNADPNAVYAKFRAVLARTGKEGLRPDSTTATMLAAFALGRDKWDADRATFQPTPCTVGEFRGKVERWIVRSIDQLEIRSAADVRADEEKKKAERKVRRELEKAARKAMIAEFKNNCAKQDISVEKTEEFVTRLCKEKYGNAKMQELFDLYLRKHGKNAEEQAA